MKAEHHSSSDSKDNTPPVKGGSDAFKPPRPLLATAVIGAALIGYLIHKTPDARLRLESLANMARTMGDLTERDAAIVTELLSGPTSMPHIQGGPRYVF